MRVSRFCIKEPVYVSSKSLVQPRTPPDEELCEEILKKLGVNTILNVSVDHRATKKHKEWYERLGIAYHEILISDYLDPPTQYYTTFLDRCVEWYHSLPAKKRCVLIHCTAGINRSNGAAGAILWSQLVYPSRTYSTPDKLIEWMIKSSCRSIFLNSSIKMSLNSWCLENECYSRC